MFSSHYLQAACLFSITFNKHSQKLLAKMVKRRRWLMVLDFFAYTFIIVMTLLGHYINAQIVLGALWTAFFWAVAITTLFAMRHI